MSSKYLQRRRLIPKSLNSANPAVQATAQTMNHPEILSGFWELKFDKDPTAIDVNGDGTMDWSVHGGGSFNTASLSNCTWQANGAGIDSQPGDDFSRITVADIRARATATGSWAQFAINAARSGTNCAPIIARVTLQSDGSQTVNVWRKLNDVTLDPLTTISSLPALPIDIHLVIDPSYGTVAINVNSQQYGTFLYNVFTSSDSSRSASITSSGNAEFDYLRIREVTP